MAQQFNYPMGSSGKPPAKKMAKAPVAVAGHAEPDGDEFGGEEPEDGAAIAEEHGPATDVSIHHEHEGGAHHVTSEHPDGHHHESDHESAEAAHEHGKKLAGVGSEETDEGEEW